MINAKNYLSRLTGLLRQQWGERLVYVGLQGSYLRGEATENSDLDIMVVVDKMDVAGLDTYREAIRSLGDVDKSCGFICSKTDLAHWNPLEICHLVNSTKDYHGTLSELVPAYTREDVRNFVKLSLNNLYHEICHRYLHASYEDNAAYLPGTYKGVFFILQNLYYLQEGEFISTKAGLLPLLSGKDREILHTAMQLNSGEPYDFSQCFKLLFTWCQDTLEVL